MKASLKRDSPEMKRLCTTAAEHGIAVSLGYSENEDNSLYITQSHISADGEITMTRRKTKPTHLERTIYGDGNGLSLLNVVDTPGVGKVGGLCCWEHTQPLLKYHTHSQGEEIHVASWPPMLPFQGKGLWSTAAEGKQILRCSETSSVSCEGSNHVGFRRGEHEQKSCHRRVLLRAPMQRSSLTTHDRIDEYH